MPRLARICDTVLTVGSGVAFGVIAMTAVVAAVAFPRMKQLSPTLPEYSGYDGPHWSLAAGWIAEGVFEIGFIVAAIAVALCVLAVGGRWVAPCRGARPIGRAALVVALTALFAAHLGWLQREMDAAAGTYREAASAGNNDAATEAKAEFDSLHPLASRLIGATTLAAFGLFVFSAWQAGAPTRGEHV